MNNFENLKSMSIDEFAEWLDANGMFDGSLWNQWFDERYCSQCELIEAHYEESGRVCKCAYCEVYEKCRYFVDCEDVPDNKTVIKLWLEAEVE